MLKNGPVVPYENDKRFFICNINIGSLINASQKTVTFTQPYSKLNQKHSGWNTFVKSFRSARFAFCVD